MAKRIADWRLPYPDKYITGHFGTLSAFRKARNMQPHSGTDWARPLGTRIPAIAKGTIRLIQFSKVLGWVVVQTAMDKDGQIWYIGYCHLDNKPGYEVGQVLTKGQTVGLIGNTGISSGPHLHATASKTLKGVFGATSAKVDLYKLILANTKGAETEQADTQEEAVVQPQTIVTEKPTIVYACPHCKKELK
jgi:murein DD-endopeptidase MepM/ murein hydrolase activator NlpD